MTEEHPPISVIIPTYNRAGYLSQAITSILQQTLPPTEIIVVDDGSKDETATIVRRMHGPIHLIRQTHRGVAAARNLGLQRARGQIIAWLDSDDMWEPDFLTVTVAALMSDASLGGVYTGILLIDAEGQPTGLATRTEPPETLYKALTRDNFIATPAMVVRKSCYDTVGNFDTQFLIAEDYDMWLRLSKQCRIQGIPRPLVRIRVHEANTMHNVDLFRDAHLALARKHFGDSKTAYGYTLRTIALKYIEMGDEQQGWHFLMQAARYHPPILARLDTFYELACGHQPRGRRGRAAELNIESNASAMMHGLDALFDDASPEVLSMQPDAYGNAYLALAMLSDQAGRWGPARRYLLQAIRYHPALLRDRKIIRRMLKLIAGKRLTGKHQ